MVASDVYKRGGSWYGLNVCFIYDFTREIIDCRLMIYGNASKFLYFLLSISSTVSGLRVSPSVGLF